jgi:hypothetical protein
MLFARGAHLAKMTGDCIVGADNRMNDADTDRVSVLLAAECQKRSGAFHQVCRYLPVV